MISVNNKLFLKPYTGDHKIKSKIQGGFASVDQKNNLIGLELVVDFIHLSNASLSLTKGSVIYFLEADLYSAPWAKVTYNNINIKEPFIIADFSAVKGVFHNDL